MTEFAFIIPFFFVMAIVYGAMEVSGVFRNRGVKTIISVVIAFFAASSPQTAEFIFFVLPWATIFFVIVFFVGFLTSSKRGEKDWQLVAIVAGLLVIALANSDLQSILGENSGNILAAAALIFIAIIIYAVYRHTK